LIQEGIPADQPLTLGESTNRRHHQQRLEACSIRNQDDRRVRGFFE